MADDGGQGGGKLGFNAAWSMAVGGMVGGGIFSTLGVVISIAGKWAWASFVTAGVIALLAGYAYVKLAKHFGEGGGAFAFLREENAKGFAGSLAWVLIVGYVLTNAVYASTFGVYLGHVFGLEGWFDRAAAVGILAVFIGLNLRGAGEAGGVEIVLVWFKVAVLLGLAGLGLWRWNPDMLSRSGDAAAGGGLSGIGVAMFGAASVFMAYEGFQLLAYDYDDIKNPDRTLPWAVLTAIAAVIVIYVMVALGTAMLIGADAIVENEEISLSIAGKEAMGTAGLIAVTVAAAFSTGSAINSTLFATARLARQVAEGDELPRWFGKTNSKNVPGRSVVALGGFAAALAVVGTLSTLVEAASLAFLFTFSVVCGLAWRAKAGRRWITGAGALLAAAATVALVVRLVRTDWWAIVFLFALGAIAVFVRPVILRRMNGSSG
ncbi:MAG: APC family permease [Planctomycetota bacterium]|nr:MAG: APC family permease [Planctomycetota bacterium]